MVEEQTLTDYSEKERTAYLGAVASMATPQNQAEQEQLDFLEDLCSDAELSPENCDDVLNEARNPDNEGLGKYLEWLKDSDLKYSFVVDVISFARADGEYTDEEKNKIHKMADKLGLSISQYEALNEYVEKAEQSEDEDTSEEGFLERTGLKQKLEKNNIPVKSLLSGLVGSLLMKGVMGRRHRRGGILSKLMGGSSRKKSGGISSLMSMIGGKGSYKKSGGLLSKLLKK